MLARAWEFCWIFMKFPAVSSGILVPRGLVLACIIEQLTELIGFADAGVCCFHRAAREHAGDLIR